MKLIAVLLTSALFFTACGETRSTESTGAAATVSSEDLNFEISNDQVAEVAADWIATENEFAPEEQKVPEEEVDETVENIKPTVVNNLIVLEVLKSELASREIEVTEEIQAESDDELRTGLEENWGVSADDVFARESVYLDFVREISAAQFTLLDDLAEGTELETKCISHILMSTAGEVDPETGQEAELSEAETAELSTAAKERIDAAFVRVTEGEEDFAEVAIDVSEGPSGPTGGALGCADTSSYVPEFAEVADNTDLGDISEPFETDFGWHILTIVEPTDDDRQLAAQTEYGDVLTAIFTGLTVEIDPEIGTWDDVNFGVVANVDESLELEQSDGSDVVIEETTEGDTTAEETSEEE